MLSMTIEEAINPDIELLISVEDKGEYVYLYKHGNIVFYVGKSVHPFQRLLEHLGKYERWLSPCDAIGQLITDNFPESLQWIVEIKSLAEIHAEQKSSIKISLADMEQALITSLCPCMNGLGKRGSNPLPDKYNKRPIANEGVIQSQ